MMTYFSSFKEKSNSIGNPLYSSDMPFSDYCLFQSLQRYLKETRFPNYDKMETGRNFQWIFQFTDFFRKKELDNDEENLIESRILENQENLGKKFIVNILTLFIYLLQISIAHTKNYLDNYIKIKINFTIKTYTNIYYYIEYSNLKKKYLKIITSHKKYHLTDDKIS